jgi:hypothetical protein
VIVGATCLHFYDKWWKHVSSTSKNGGNICLTNLKSVQVGAALLAALIIGHDAMFTLFSVYSFGTLFHSYNNF